MNPIISVLFALLMLVVLVFAIMKKFKWQWVNDYALPISLVLGMAAAIPITAWLG